ncbi:MAG: hypothetical protein J2P21_04025 [Chloracidobacterium sp.]|nr:hypothetical protein [Chloracidobacterium sp.]
MSHSRTLIATFAFSLVVFCFSFAPAQTFDRAQIQKDIQSLYDQIEERQKLLLAPSKEDLEAYTKYLKRPDLGLIRLLPGELYRGYGAFYSFTRLTHEYGYGSDIELSQGLFRIGFAGYDFGFLVDLGETPLEEAAIEHPGLKFLLNFTPPLTEPEIRAQQRQCDAGMQAGEFSYRSSLAPIVGHTYGLRSVSYDRSDTLVALQVVRQDDDGSVILVWKLMKKFAAPKPERNNQS